METNKLSISLEPIDTITSTEFDLDRIIFDLDKQIDMLSSKADSLDYLVSIASGVLCGILDIVWVGEFSLDRGRAFASEEIDKLVLKSAKLLGFEGEDMSAAVAYLEKKFPIPSDGNTPDFGGGLQHHLRDFAHHPTIVGLVFSLLTQYTYQSYGTDVNGKFIVVPVPERSRVFIGNDTPSKILYGTLTWFFHLVSDMAGSSSSAGRSGGTGIPGPILALAKELSVLPLIHDITIDEKPLSLFLSKLFNGTLLAQHDENGKIIKDTVLKFDLRGELGVITELGRQALPVLANECIVRAFYFIRRLAVQIKALQISSFDDIKQIPWKDVIPGSNPTLARMLTIATGVFTTIDIGEAIVTEKYFVSINYVGVGRFAVAIGEDISWGLKARNIQKVKQAYEEMRRSVYTKKDGAIYDRIGDSMDIGKLGLTVDQTEILYNLEYHMVLNDIEATKLIIGSEGVKELKSEWLEEWKAYMTNGFSSFLQVENALLHWYSLEELAQRIKDLDAGAAWFRLVLLEAMLFEPYYALSFEQDKKGNAVPSKKYNNLHNPFNKFSSSKGDLFLATKFADPYYPNGYIKRLRKCYDKVTRELTEVLKTALTAVAVTAGIALATVITAGAFAPSIAVFLVGSNFAGLSGAALTSACLAYIGGGAIAVGGLGMAGGTAVIVGGGAVLGLGVGAGVGGAAGAAGMMGKKNTIIQSAKLMVSIREIFLNDEHDVEYSTSIFEHLKDNILEIENGLTELRLEEEDAKGKDKKLLKEQIKRAEESVNAMKIARRSLVKFKSSFEEGLAAQDKQ